jgi:hypothetical protein
VELRQVDLAGGTVISCRLSGETSAPPVVLLHALGEDAGSWDKVAARFATQFRVVALDLRGHGTSSWPGHYSFLLMRDDVLGVLDALDLSDVVLVGHSKRTATGCCAPPCAASATSTAPTPRPLSAAAPGAHDRHRRGPNVSTLPGCRRAAEPSPEPLLAAPRAGDPLKGVTCAGVGCRRASPR